MGGKNDKEFVGILREHGVQVTYQRLAIYNAINSTMDHPSADVIYQKVKKRFPMVSLGTVYKTLEKFYEVGLIEKVSPISEVVRYEALTRPHHHMVCIGCRSIQDFNMPEEPEITFSLQNGFHVLRQEVVLHGYCPDCKGKITDLIAK